MAGLRLRITKTQKTFYRERYLPLGHKTYQCGASPSKPKVVHGQILNILVYMGEFGLSARAAARQENVSLTNIEKWQRQDPVLAEAIAEAREIADDRVLYGVYEAATVPGKDGRISIPAAKMWLMYRQPELWRNMEDGGTPLLTRQDDAQLLVELVRISATPDANRHHGAPNTGHEVPALGSGDRLEQDVSPPSKRTNGGVEHLAASVGKGRRKNTNGRGNGKKKS